MATTTSVRFVPVSCFIYRSEEAKACDKWSIFVKIKLKETMVDLRERFAINDYGGFKKQSRWKARLSARCKAQEAWSSGVFEWPAVQAPIKYLQNPWLFLSAFNLTGTILMRQLPASSITTVFTKKRRWKFRGIKGSTSQTQGPNGTLSATTLNSVKMILEGLTRLRTKVMELRSCLLYTSDAADE